MLKKSVDFDTVLNNDLDGLNSFSSGEKIKKKGSYFKKKYGDIVTDVDVNIYLDSKEDVSSFIQKITNFLSLNKNFIFLYMKHGEREDIKPICSIQSSGKCIISSTLSLSNWISTLKNKVDSDIFKNIAKVFKQSKISLQDVINVDAKLKPYRELTWNTNEILSGFKIVNEKKISISGSFHVYSLMRYLYVYKEYVCLLDIAIKKVNTNPERDITVLEKYYSQDSYKILKAFKWYLTYQGIKQAYLPFLDQIKELILLQTKIELRDYIIKYQPVSRLYIDKINKEISDLCSSLKITETQVNLELNRKCKQKMNELRSHIDPLKFNEILKFESIYKESEIPLTFEELKKKYEK